jgi:hypothetical protein
MSTVLDAFRETVMFPHVTEPWACRLWRTICFVTKHPEHAIEVGVIPCPPNAVFVHSRIHVNFCGLAKYSSCNRNFKQHGFFVDHKCNVVAELQLVVRDFSVSFSPRSWAKRVFILGQFNCNSSLDEIAAATAYAKRIRTSRGNQSPQLLQPTNPERQSDDWEYPDYPYLFSDESNWD